MAPVTGSRRGAPAARSSSAISGEDGQESPERPAQALGLGVRDPTFRLIRPLAVVGAEPRLDHALGDQHADDGEEHAAGDREVEVGGQVDRDVRVEQMDGVVGDLGQDAVDRHDEHVDQEHGGHAGEGGGDAGDRMAPDGEECRGAQRDEHQVAGIRGDARQDADDRR